MRNDSEEEEGVLNLGTSFMSLLICSLVEEFIETLLLTACDQVLPRSSSFESTAKRDHPSSLTGLHV